MHALATTSTLARFVVPNGDADFQNLTAIGREEIRRMLGILGRVAAAGPGQLVAALQREADHAGIAYGTVRAKWYALEAAGGDWRAIINRARKGASNVDNAALPPEFIEHCRQCCLGNKRAQGNKQALAAMVAAWRAGERIPGYGTWRNVWPDRRTCPQALPAGWSYRNLLRFMPSKFELAMARRGREAATAYRPGVRKTRVGLWVGSNYMFDDIWHDDKTQVPGQRRTCRPLELHSLDLFSGYKPAYGLKPLFADTPEGELKALGKQHMHFLLACLLGGEGYDAERGTTLMVENGTAAIGGPLEELLHNLTGGKITVSRAGMNGSAAIAGMYEGRAKGNFRFKAALESLGNLIHNMFGALPGQMGPRYDLAPEELHGREKGHDALVLAMSAMPAELANQLRLPVLPWEDFRRAAADIYTRMNRRTDHRLEGWELAGLMVAEFTRNNGMDWEPMESVPLIEDALERGAVEAYLAARNDVTRVRRLSPWEVWQRGRSRLTRLPGSAVAAILGPDINGRERKVGHDHLFTFEDKDLGPGRHSYEAHVSNERLTGGRKQWLQPGEKMLCVVNPFDLGELHVFDAHGRYWGACPRCRVAGASDLEDIKRSMGHALAIEKELRAPLAAYGTELARKRIADAEHNAALMQRAGKPSAKGVQREKIEVVTVPLEPVEDDDDGADVALLLGGSFSPSLSTPSARSRSDQPEIDQAEGDDLGLIL